MKQQQGFTLVELIMVIVLIGIVSVTATVKFSGRSAFDAQLTRDQAISVIRQIQLSSMQGHSTALKVDADCLGECPLTPNDRDQSLRQAQTDTTFSLADGASSSFVLFFNLLGQPRRHQQPDRR